MATLDKTKDRIDAVQADLERSRKVLAESRRERPVLEAQLRSSRSALTRSRARGSWWTRLLRPVR